VLRQVREGSTDLTERLRPTPSIVKRDQLIADLFELAVESPLPVAVTDEQDRLIGVVPRATLLAALADLPTTTTEIPVIEPTPEVPAAMITQTLEESAVGAPGAPLASEEAH
jgi:glycine betaine/proline transport system ATP-binding protein